jgi:hypothetical protein
MTPEKELWACALLVEREHGERAPVWIATRIGELTLAGDRAGIERWTAIAAKLDQCRARDLQDETTTN